MGVLFYCNTGWTWGDFHHNYRKHVLKYNGITDTKNGQMNIIAIQHHLFFSWQQ